MQAECVTNSCNNTNFTVGQIYEMTETGIRTNWGNMWTSFKDWDKPHSFAKGTIFKFEMCEFIIKS